MVICERLMVNFRFNYLIINFLYIFRIKVAHFDTMCQSEMLGFGDCYKHFEPNGSLSSCLIESLGSKCL